MALSVRFDKKMFKLPKFNELPPNVTRGQLLVISEKISKLQELTPEEHEIAKLMIPEQVNSCDGCNVCCVAPAIDKARIDGEVIKKPKKACEVCPNSVDNRCSAYTQRPDVCKDYLCAYAMGCTDIHPMKHGVAWSFNTNHDKGLVIGHALNVDDVFRNEEIVDLMVEMLNTPMIDNVTVMDSIKAVSIDSDTGRCLGAKIDQKSELKNMIDEKTIVNLGTGVPYITE